MRRKKILVACEFSGVVRDAFIRAGHDAVSCDLLPSELPGPHIQDDVLNHLNKGWDMMIAHPPCNHLASSGAQYWPQKKADGRQQKAILFFQALINAPINKICVENPVGIMGTIYRKADQIIQPWQFGEPYNKKTCLWLTGLPALLATNIVEPRYNWGTNSWRSGSRKKSNLPVLKSSSKERSRFFSGIAEAMAAQWG